MITERQESSEVVNDDTPCVKCGKYDQPQWVSTPVSLSPALRKKFHILVYEYSIVFQVASRDCLVNSHGNSSALVVTVLIL